MPARPRAVSFAAALVALVATGFVVVNGQAAVPADAGKPAASVSTPEARPAAKSAGLLNDWLRKESEAMRAWDIGGDVRMRYVNSEGAVSTGPVMTATPSGTKPLTTPVNANNDFIAKGKPNDNEELLLRERFHVGYTPVSWFTVFGEFRNSTASWDQRHPSPNQDETDLHQAYLAFGDPKLFPLVGIFGRQVLNYGDRRLVSDPPWLNNGRTFDAVRLRFVSDAVWVDAFAGHQVVPQQDHFNRSNSDDLLTGIYASTDKLLPWQETQLYFLARNANSNAISSVDSLVPGAPATARDIYIPGLRFKSLPGKLGGWDYTVEAAGQFGSIHNATLKKRLDQQAYAVFANVGYTWTNTWGAPRLGVGYEGGSGDSNPKDGRNETFDSVFGTIHQYYGQMDLFGYRNLQIPRVGASLTPLKNLVLTVDYLKFWLADTQDYLYPASGPGRNSNGYGIHPTFDSYVGSEADVIAKYAPLAWLKLEAGYGHFFVGDYIRQSVKSVAANGGTVDADWCYVQTTISF
ncbi:MAG: alginate export family protein [Verrucomicrobia bacterium]|nr:alginate export family protein [Verrucomicrobiota bacterium]